MGDPTGSWGSAGSDARMRGGVRVVVSGVPVLAFL